jgi:hypothetical protein
MTYDTLLLAAIAVIFGVDIDLIIAALGDLGSRSLGMLS